MFLIQSDDSTVVVQLDGTDADKRPIGRVVVEGENTQKYYIILSACIHLTIVIRLHPHARLWSKIQESFKTLYNQVHSTCMEAQGL